MSEISRWKYKFDTYDVRWICGLSFNLTVCPFCFSVYAGIEITVAAELFFTYF